jgi:hypothetical protein
MLRLKRERTYRRRLQHHKGAVAIVQRPFLAEQVLDAAQAFEHRDESWPPKSREEGVYRDS